MPSPSERELRRRRHELYEIAVQDPDSEVEFVSSTFRRLRRRKALTLREDFCGTAIFSLAWAESNPTREAWGVDLHRPTLEWGAKNRISKASDQVQGRVHLERADVRGHGLAPVDVAVAFNFSYWCFQTREALLEYFRVARQGLVEDGVFFLDCYGGSEMVKTSLDRRDCGDFYYEWEHASFDAITSQMRAYIHFEMKDGRRVEKAFRYDWRAWTLREIQDLLLDAGFSKVRVFWEKEDEDGDGTGRFHQVRSVDNEGLWWAYIAAER